MSRVIPEEGDKGRSEPAPDHHQGPAELSTRRWYPEQPYPSRPDNSMGRIKKWPLPRIIVIDSSHIADFPSHPFRSLLIANLHLPRLPPITSEANPSTMGISPIIPDIPSVTRPSGTCIFPASPPITSETSPSTRGLSPIGITPLHDRFIHCRAPSRPGGAFTASSTVAAGRASQAADCAENSPQRPSFGQTGRKALFPWHGGLTPVRGIINIRSVSTRQAIPP